MTDQINKYIKLIENNSRFFDLITGRRLTNLNNADFSGWQVTTIFYISCIYFKTVAVVFEVDVRDHHSLRQMLNTEEEIWRGGIAKSYRYLEEASRDARYEGRAFTEKMIKERILFKFEKVKERAIYILEKNEITNVPDVNLRALFERKKPES